MVLAVAVPVNTTLTLTDPLGGQHKSKVCNIGWSYTYPGGGSKAPVTEILHKSQKVQPRIRLVLGIQRGTATAATTAEEYCQTI